MSDLRATTNKFSMHNREVLKRISETTYAYGNAEKLEVILRSVDPDTIRDGNSQAVSAIVDAPRREGYHTFAKSLVAIKKELDREIHQYEEIKKHGLNILKSADSKRSGLPLDDDDKLKELSSILLELLTIPPFPKSLLSGDVAQLATFIGYEKVKTQFDLALNLLTTFFIEKPAIEKDFKQQMRDHLDVIHERLLARFDEYIMMAEDPILPSNDSGPYIHCLVSALLTKDIPKRPSINMHLQSVGISIREYLNPEVDESGPQKEIEPYIFVNWVLDICRNDTALLEQVVPKICEARGGFLDAELRNKFERTTTKLQALSLDVVTRILTFLQSSLLGEMQILGKVIEITNCESEAYSISNLVNLVTAPMSSTLMHFLQQIQTVVNDEERKQISKLVYRYIELLRHGSLDGPSNAVVCILGDFAKDLAESYKGD